MKWGVKHKAVLSGLLTRLLFLLAALAMFLGMKAGRAQEVKFTCTAPPVIAVGDQFRVSFAVNVAGTDFKGPAFKGFSVLSGPNQSSSSSIQIINGAMTQTVSYSYTYILRADQEGEFDIAPATVSINGVPVKSQGARVKVVKGNAQAGGRSSSQSGQSQPGQQQQGNRQGSGGESIASGDLFVKTILSKSDVYQGEHILVTQKIYSKVNLVGFDDVKYPSYGGFWSTEVKMPEQISLKKETYNGEVYNVAELKKTILFPQKSGTLTIEPIDVTAVVQVRSQNRRRTGDPFFDNFFNDPFFGSAVQNVKKSVKSAPVTVRVKPLPEPGKPEGFNGAVGSFTISAALDKTTLKANEAINYRVTVSGNGNLELIDKLEVPFPGDFEVYEPKVSGNITASAGGVSGSRIFEYLIIPRNPGKFRIEPVSFSFFNLAGRSYVQLQTQGFDIEVGKGDGTQTAYSGVNKEDIRLLGSDIRFIKTRVPAFSPLGSFFFNTWPYWLFLLLPAVLFTLVLVIWRRRIRVLSDKSMMKHKKATRVAVRRLKKAAEYMKRNEGEAFYIEISQALWGYLSDKLFIPVSRLSAENAREALSGKAVPEELVNQYLQTIESCEYARFAPGGAMEKMDAIYHQAMEAITRTEKTLKS